MSIRRSHRSGAVLVAVAALAAGCGSGATSEASPTSASSSSTSAAPRAPSATASVATAPATTAAVTAKLPAGRHVETYAVRGVTRTAVVVVPKSLTMLTPLVFVFHGHGGTGPNIERKFDIEGLWPEAIVVYPNGVVGHAGKTDPTGVKTGWQSELGETGDSDLAFYDTMLASLRAALPVDSNRIYAMGHSNGSVFVSLLLNQRGAGIAATANLSGQPVRLLATDPTRSMFMAMGMTDPIVPYDNQKRAIPIAEQKIGAEPARATVTGYLRSEKGRGNLELETYVYPGGHEPPAIVPRLVVDFFRRHTLAAG